MKNWTNLIKLKKFRLKPITNNKNEVALYIIALSAIMLGLAYIAVPLYQIFCQTYGLGGIINKNLNNSSNIDIYDKNIVIKSNRNNNMNSILIEDNKQLNEQNILIHEKSKNLNKPITIYFNAENKSNLPWILKSSIPKLNVYPGDTALTFYLAQNLSTETITGIATYNIVPAKVGVYFNKIQCFCFEEQRLKGKESVELPVLFFIDQDFRNDPKMNDIDSITLSYTFFKTID
jgi:cytochrome c oxidase assembly protein subunit 11